MTVYDPSTISGLSYRWQPHSGCFQDAAGTIASTDGTAIGNLPGLVGGYAATNSNTAAKPTFKIDDNGWGYALFDGVDDQLKVTVSPFLAQPFTLVVVANVLDLAGGSRFLVDGNGAYRVILWIASNEIGIWSTGGPTKQVEFPPGQRFVQTALFNGASSVNRIDEVESTSGTSPGDNGFSGLTIGGHLTNLTRQTNCRIYDILTYNRGLTLTERNTITAGLSGMYASPLSAPRKALSGLSGRSGALV